MWRVVDRNAPPPAHLARGLGKVLAKGPGKARGANEAAGQFHTFGELPPKTCQSLSKHNPF